MSILLIYPPFGSPRGPYISIPTLVTYLRSRHIPVRVLDANNLFYRKFLEPSHLRKASSFIGSRLSELNDRKELQFSDLVEYTLLVRACDGVSQAGEGIYRLLDHEVEEDIEKRIAAVNAAVSLATTMYYPEVVETNGDFTFYFSPFSEYSSSDIMKSLEKSRLFPQFLKAILPAAFEEGVPRIVGISVCFPSQIQAAFQCAKVIRRIAPQTHITLGGAFISCHLREIREPKLFEGVDSFVVDDGELPLEALYGELSKPVPDFSRVPGLIYLSEGKIFKNEPSLFLGTDSPSPPAYQAFPLDDYLMPRKYLYFALPFSRGCNWAHCTFCRTELSMVRHRRKKSLDNFFEQIRSLVQETGVRLFGFSDESASPESLEMLSHRLISENLKIGWSTSLRFDPRLTIERCVLYRQAGCYMVILGLEAYNNRLLKLMNKGITTQLIDRILSNMFWAGLPASVYMIMGFPTETKEEAAESYQKIEKMREEGYISRCLYSPFQVVKYSEIGRHPERFGITELYVPEKMDLYPPVLDFESTGMSRQDMKDLAAETGVLIGGAISKSTYKARILPEKYGETNAPLQEVRLNGKTIPLRYDLRLIHDLLNKVGGALFFDQWMSLGQRNIRPLKRDEVFRH